MSAQSPSSEELHPLAPDSPENFQMTEYEPENRATDNAYARLEDAVLDEVFPDVDLALRRGRHVDRDDGPWYVFLVEAEAQLVPFYQRFGCELVHRTDGYYFLLPTSDRLGRRHLSFAEMLVGQALTLLYLDPATVQQGGRATREQLFAQLASTMGSEALVRSLNPQRKRYDERVAEETARSKLNEAVRRLAALGFVELLDGDAFRLRPALMRFAEPVRGTASPDEALERLVQAGEVVFAPVSDEANDTIESLAPDAETDADAELAEGEPFAELDEAEPPANDSLDSLDSLEDEDDSPAPWDDSL
ncbi:MAG TPA: chromosome partition protein MukE [Polyangiaceae bacterium]|nr:chromosome partition protein MukE [Polyangiaceae bacterium]